MNVHNLLYKEEYEKFVLQWRGVTVLLIQFDLKYIRSHLGITEGNILK